MSTILMLFACFQICASSTMTQRNKRIWIAALFAIAFVASNVVIVQEAPAEQRQEYRY